MRWRHDTTFSVHINEAGEAQYDNALSRFRLGSVFVDDANRLFFTPPRGATLFYPKPKNVDEIESVTHLARKGIIVFEWTQDNDPLYHVGVLDVKTRRPVYSFPLGDSLNAHEMLTWIDDHRLLGQFVARQFSEYGVVNLRRRTVSGESTSRGLDPDIVRDGQVHRYHISDRSNPPPTD